MEIGDLSREKVRKYFGDKLKGEITDSEYRDLAFVLLDEKPGALVMGAEKTTVKVLEDFCKDFGLQIRVVEGGNRSKMDKVLRQDNRFDKDSIYVARENERFEILEDSTGRFNGFSDRAVGKFLGYPDSAVNYYTEKTEEGAVGMELEERISEMIEEGEISEKDRESLETISYLPRPEDERIREAIDEGQRRKKLFEEFCEKFGLEISEY